jgi:hypothetical protein
MRKEAKMKNQDYHASMVAKITPKEALDEISRVTDWWGKHFEGRSQKINDVFTVRFGSGDMYKMRVSELIPDTKIVWEVVDSFKTGVKDATEWTGTKILWEVSEQKDGIRIDMTHLGMNPDIECYGVCTQGWDYLLQKSLLKLLTENKGNPA